MSDSRKALTGFGWIAVGDWTNRALGFVTTLILAKLLAPSDFGAVAVAMMTISVLHLFRDLGVSQALIYRRGDLEQAAGTGLMMVMAVNIVLCLITVGAAPLVASFYDNPVLLPVTAIMAMNFLWMGLSSVPESLIRKRVQFHRLVVPTIVPVAVGSAVGLVMAYQGYGVWSLVVRTQVVSVLGMALLWYFVPVRVTFAFDRAVARELFGYGKHIVAISVFYVILDNLDRFLVSTVVSVAALGYYTLALRIAKMPVTEFSHIVCRIMFPMLTRVNDNPDRLRRATLLMVRYSSLISIPMALGICIFGPSLVAGFYGPRWAPMVVPLQILALYAMVRSVTSLFGETFKAIGQPRLSQRFVLFRLLVIGALGYPATVLFGIPGMCLLMLGSETATFFLQSRVITGRLDLAYRDLLRAFLTPALLAPGAIGGGFAALAALGLTQHLPTVLGSVVGVAVLYFGAVLAVDSEVRGRMRATLRGQESRTAPAPVA
jgi:O-antigen/teichoic acid export membrane protein